MSRRCRVCGFSDRRSRDSRRSTYLRGPRLGSGCWGFVDRAASRGTIRFQSTRLWRRCWSPSCGGSRGGVLPVGDGSVDVDRRSLYQAVAEGTVCRGDASGSADDSRSGLFSQPSPLAPDRTRSARSPRGARAARTRPSFVRSVHRPAGASISGSVKRPGAVRPTRRGHGFAVAKYDPAVTPSISPVSQFPPSWSGLTHLPRGTRSRSLPVSAPHPPIRRCRRCSWRR
jgi:hypothetical protein